MATLGQVHSPWPWLSPLSDNCTRAARTNWPDTRYLMLGKDHFEGRATAIAVVIDSVCTTGIGRVYLRTKCQPLARVEDTAEWQRAIGI